MRTYGELRGASYELREQSEKATPWTLATRNSQLVTHTEPIAKSEAKGLFSPGGVFLRGDFYHV